jgi:hypothetical protein
MKGQKGGSNVYGSLSKRPFLDPPASTQIPSPPITTFPPPPEGARRSPTDNVETCCGAVGKGRSDILPPLHPFSAAPVVQDSEGDVTVPFSGRGGILAHQGSRLPGAAHIRQHPSVVEQGDHWPVRCDAVSGQSLLRWCVRLLWIIVAAYTLKVASAMEELVEKEKGMICLGVDRLASLRGWWHRNVMASGCNGMAVRSGAMQQQLNTIQQQLDAIQQQLNAIQQQINQRFDQVNDQWSSAGLQRKAWLLTWRRCHRCPHARLSACLISMVVI